MVRTAIRINRRLCGVAFLTVAAHGARGFVAQIGVGYRLADRFAAQAELAGAAFPTPDNVFAGPCPLTGCGPGTPSGAVGQAALGATAMLLPSAKESGGYLVAGAGVRRLIADPARQGEMAPFLQAGVDV